MNAIVEQLKSTATATKATDLRAAFVADPQRFSRFSVSLDDLLMDYSKTAVNDDILALLVKLAETGGVEAKRDVMFSGKAINFTESRAVLHTALRNRSNTPVIVDGKDVMPDVNAVLAAMGEFADGIRSGSLKGRPARRSPTSSTSASAAPTSAPSWRRWRWRLSMMAPARTSFPTSTAPISPTR